MPGGGEIVPTNVTLMRREAAAIALIGCGCAPPAGAVDAIAGIGVSLAVQARCTVSASPLAFGAGRMARLNASTTILATCGNAAAAYSIDVTTASGATVTTRRVAGSTRAFLSYGMRLAAPRLSDRIPARGDGSAAEHARAPALQNIAFGLYDDVVTVTVSY